MMVVNSYQYWKHKDRLLFPRSSYFEKPFTEELGIFSGNLPTKRVAAKYQVGLRDRVCNYGFRYN
jgi:hypothetical protein